MGQILLTNDGFNIHLRVVGRTQNLANAPAGGKFAMGEIFDFDFNQIAGVDLCPQPNLHRRAKLFVQRPDFGPLAAQPVATDQTLVSAVQNFDNASVRT